MTEQVKAYMCNNQIVLSLCYRLLLLLLFFFSFSLSHVTIFSLSNFLTLTFYIFTMHPSYTQQKVGQQNRFLLFKHSKTCSTQNNMLFYHSWRIKNNYLNSLAYSLPFFVCFSLVSNNTHYKNGKTLFFLFLLSLTLSKYVYFFLMHFPSSAHSHS